MQPFFTIGHATRPLDELVSLLRANGVTLLVDVRTVPRSRTNPQFNTDVLPGSLGPHGIAYRHMPPLGGLRPRRPEVPPEVNGFWENESFHNYADYAMTPQFAHAMEELMNLGSSQRLAVMCAETVWWRCHRRIITDYLLARGCDVFHIVSSEVPEPARITPEAVPRDGHLEYPGAQASLL